MNCRKHIRVLHAHASERFNHRRIENSLRLHRIRRELISVRYCLELFCNELRSVMMMYSYEECRHAFACAFDYASNVFGINSTLFRM